MQEEEVCIESKHTRSSDKAPGRKDSKNSSNSNTNSNSNNHNQSKPHSSNNGNSASSTPNKGSSSKDKPKNSISDKLGKNGKLVDCPKSKAAKACAATVTAESKLDSTDSKK